MSRPATLEESGFYSAETIKYLAILVEKLGGTVSLSQDDYTVICEKYDGDPMVDLHHDLEAETITITNRKNLLKLQLGTHYVKDEIDETIMKVMEALDRTDKL